MVITSCCQDHVNTLQALQHPWVVKAEGREDQEECSLDWGLDGNEYAVSVRDWDHHARSAPEVEWLA